MEGAEAGALEGAVTPQVEVVGQEDAVGADVEGNEDDARNNLGGQGDPGLAPQKPPEVASSADADSGNAAAGSATSTEIRPVTAVPADSGNAAEGPAASTGIRPITDAPAETGDNGATIGRSAPDAPQEASGGAGGTDQPSEPIITNYDELMGEVESRHTPVEERIRLLYSPFHPAIDKFICESLTVGLKLYASKVCEGVQLDGLELDALARCRLQPDVNYAKDLNILVHSAEERRENLEEGLKLSHEGVVTAAAVDHLIGIMAHSAKTILFLNHHDKQRLEKARGNPTYWYKKSKSSLVTMVDSTAGKALVAMMPYQWHIYPDTPQARKAAEAIFQMVGISNEGKWTKESLFHESLRVKANYGDPYRYMLGIITAVAKFWGNEEGRLNVFAHVDNELSLYTSSVESNSMLMRQNRLSVAILLQRYVFDQRLHSVIVYSPWEARVAMQHAQEWSDNKASRLILIVNANGIAVYDKEEFTFAVRDDGEGSADILHLTEHIHEYPADPKVRQWIDQHGQGGHLLFALALIMSKQTRWSKAIEYVYRLGEAALERESRALPMY